MAAPNTDVPHSEKGWLELLSEILSTILRAVGEATSHLFDTLWPCVVAAWNTAKNFVIAHPHLTCAVATLVLGVLIVHPLTQAALWTFGFRGAGVLAGSPAAHLQASLYGGAVPAGSVFALFQSLGAR